jgi:ferredoxin-NADP reductase
LHENVEINSEILISAPVGSFVLNEEGTRPIVLVSVGSGVTPLLSMLYALIHLRTTREVWFVHGARHGAEHAYASEVRRLSDRSPNVTAHFRYSQPREIDFMGRDHDSVGRVDPDFLTSLVPMDADFYLCGPISFMASVKAHLCERGVSPERIRLEAFGVTTNDERADPGLLGAKVRFAEDARSFIWDGSVSTLLELAEEGGLAPPHSCRAGTCGSCEHVLREGTVNYSPDPLFEVRPGHVLLCCARPQSDLTIGPSTAGAA